MSTTATASSWCRWSDSTLIFQEQKSGTPVGFLLQALGGATSEELESIQSVALKDLRKLARETTDMTQIDLKRVLPGRDFKLTEQTPLESFCTCSQERIERALILTGEDDIIEALGSDPKLEITCDFCRTIYNVSAERIKNLFGPDHSKLQ